MKKIVVTGATSSIGIALIEECIKNNIEVLVLARKESNRLEYIPKSSFVKIENCDLSSLKNFNYDQTNYDVFYHLGWAYTSKEERKHEELQEENIKYSLDAINLAKKLGVKKFIGAGSQAEYGNHVEDKVINPIEPYGICKYTSGKLLATKAIKFNMDFAWVRIFSVYGKYDTNNTMISTAISKMKTLGYCSFSPAEHIWDYLYSEDAGRALYLLGKKLVGNKVYCLGSGEGKPLKEYIQIIRDLVNKEAIIGIGDIPYENGKPNPMVADISDLTRDIGFVPKIDFIQGIRKILDYKIIG